MSVEHNDKSLSDVANVAHKLGKHVAFFMSSLTGGGVERSILTLARGFAEAGHRVDLVLCHNRGDYSVPNGIRLVELRPTFGVLARLHTLLADPGGIAVLLRPVLLPIKSSTKIRYISDLARYLRRERPDVLISAMTNPNLVALWARRLSRVPVRIVVSERNTLSSFVKHKKRQWRWRFMPSLVNRTYMLADEIIAVSNYVADDLAAIATLPRESITTIYNPVVTREISEQSAIRPDHAWLAKPDIPVILAAGRLTSAKDFSTLVRAFAQVRKHRRVRLVILGEGPQRTSLQTMIDELDVSTDVDLPGWFENPFACMAHASVFVLSSAWEGLPGVLIQAMACGCPVVSTDCPGGSREILEDGKFGPLTPVGNYESMAQSILRVLDKPVGRDALIARASVFSESCAIEQYQGRCFGIA